MTIEALSGKTASHIPPSAGFGRTSIERLPDDPINAYFISTKG